MKAFLDNKLPPILHHQLFLHSPTRYRPQERRCHPYHTLTPNPPLIRQEQLTDSAGCGHVARPPSLDAKAQKLCFFSNFWRNHFRHYWFPVRNTPCVMLTDVTATAVSHSPQCHTSRGTPCGQVYAIVRQRFIFQMKREGIEGEEDVIIRDLNNRKIITHPSGKGEKASQTGKMYLCRQSR